MSDDQHEYDINPPSIGDEGEFINPITGCEYEATVTKVMPRARRLRLSISDWSNPTRAGDNRKRSVECEFDSFILLRRQS